jgi:hypothetical protein
MTYAQARAPNPMQQLTDDGRAAMCSSANGLGRHVQSSRMLYSQGHK